MMKNRSTHIRGLTLVELLVALMVSSVILAAVATLAFAMTSAADTTDDSARKQAQLRFTTMRLSELLRSYLLLCEADGEDVAVWRADDNADQQINLNEIVYIESGPAHDHLWLCEFSSADNPQVSLAGLALAGTKSTLQADYEHDHRKLLPACSNVQFLLDVPEPCPRSKLVCIRFDLIEGGIGRHYEIAHGTRSWAGHLLNAAGKDLVAGDDD